MKMKMETVAVPNVPNSSKSLSLKAKKGKVKNKIGTFLAIMSMINIPPLLSLSYGEVKKDLKCEAVLKFPPSEFSDRIKQYEDYFEFKTNYYRDEKGLKKLKHDERLSEFAEDFARLCVWAVRKDFKGYISSQLQMGVSGNLLDDVEVVELKLDSSANHVFCITSSKYTISVDTLDSVFDPSYNFSEEWDVWDTLSFIISFNIVSNDTVAKYIGYQRVLYLGSRSFDAVMNDDQSVNIMSDTSWTHVGAGVYVVKFPCSFLNINIQTISQIAQQAVDSIDLKDKEKKGEGYVKVTPSQPMFLSTYYDTLYIFTTIEAFGKKTSHLNDPDESER